MTRDEILAKWDSLTPRERDAWVAEAVIGWKPIGDGRMKSSDNFLIRPVPGYSTDIVAAWEVVSHLEGYHVEIVRHDGKWTAAFDKYSRSVYARAENAPEAICKAALLAMME